MRTSAKWGKRRDSIFYEPGYRKMLSSITAEIYNEAEQAKAGKLYMGAKGMRSIYMLSLHRRPMREQEEQAGIYDHGVEDRRYSCIPKGTQKSGRGYYTVSPGAAR